ncbi:MAG: hypothetical protein R3C60_02695 [Parvularculaceae bacterium]
MKRNAGSRDVASKVESRFAALTGGLLARKGQAAPSNSPVADAAEETDAYSLDDALIARKLAPKPKTETPAPKKEQTPPKPATQQAKREAAQPEQKKSLAPNVKLQPAPALELSKKEQVKKAPEPVAMKVINERSVEAGYPDNPSPEEIAALEAEADEVVSYFENFGSSDDAALEKSEFLGNPEAALPEETDNAETGQADAADDEFDDGFDDELGAELAQGPWAGASVPPVAATTEPVRAGVTVQLNAREFMRLSLGASELGLSAQEIMADAIEEYLDARGVESLGGCACFAKMQGLTPAGDSNSGDAEDEGGA